MNRAEKQKWIEKETYDLEREGITPNQAKAQAKFRVEKHAQRIKRPLISKSRSDMAKALKERMSERLVKSILSVYHPTDAIEIIRRSKDIIELMAKIKGKGGKK